MVVFSIKWRRRYAFFLPDAEDDDDDDEAGRVDEGGGDGAEDDTGAGSVTSSALGGTTSPATVTPRGSVSAACREAIASSDVTTLAPGVSGSLMWNDTTTEPWCGLSFEF